MCGPDQGILNGGFPGTPWPVTPGHELAGTIADPLPISQAEETMQFAAQFGVRAWIEQRPLDEAVEGYAAMQQGRARYRGVLTV